MPNISVIPYISVMPNISAGEKNHPNQKGPVKRRWIKSEVGFSWKNFWTDKPVQFLLKACQSSFVRPYPDIQQEGWMDRVTIFKFILQINRQ